jgi:chemotaxis protein MotB
VARKKKHPEHVNHERWLVSYADFITLLFAFFTTLYAISTVDANKAGKLVYSLRASFDLNPFFTDKPTLGASSLEPPSLSGQISPRLKPIRVPGLPASHAQQKRMTQLMHRLSSVMDVYKTEHVRLTREPRGLVISIEDSSFFASGSADVLPKAKDLLDPIANALSIARLSVRVEGHADTTPLRSKRFRSNWDLSASRAVSIVNYLSQKHDYPPELLAAAGYGDTRPLVANDTPANRAKNRRIEIVVLRDVPKFDKQNISDAD